MKNINVRYIIIGIFIVFSVVGFFMFAGIGGLGGGGAAPHQTVIWGSVPARYFNDVYAALNEGAPGTIDYAYQEVPANKWDETLLQALAEGTPPDVVVEPYERLVKDESRLAVIPYTAYSERTFQDNFIEGGDLFLKSDGIIGLPFIVDPLVMYWNKDMLTSELIAVVPKTWDDMIALSGKLTKKTEDLEIKKSMFGMGEWTNVTNAKEILSMLFLQSGNPIITRINDGGYKAILAEDFGNTVAPAQTALAFYTQFADPLKSVYAWNRSLPTTQDTFLRGNSAFYFGFASELPVLKAKNPNLNFDVTTVPQPKNPKATITFGKIYGLGILKSSQFKSEAFKTILDLTAGTTAKALVTATGLPPVRRDLLASIPADASAASFYQAALQAHAFLDIDPQTTTAVFKNMVESVLSGKSEIGTLLNTANQQLEERIQNKE